MMGDGEWNGRCGVAKVIQEQWDGLRAQVLNLYVSLIRLEEQ